MVSREEFEGVVGPAVLEFCYQSAIMTMDLDDNCEVGEGNRRSKKIVRRRRCGRRKGV